jgi:hypothetical protein
VYLDLSLGRRGPSEYNSDIGISRLQQRSFVMASLAFVLPVLPGKESTDREQIERFKNEESEEFSAWNRSNGVTRHAVWHQKTPQGTTAIVLIEADDISAALRGPATSQEPFDHKFRQWINDVHGVDLATDPPADVAHLIDWRA